MRSALSRGYMRYSGIGVSLAHEGGSARGFSVADARTLPAIIECWHQIKRDSGSIRRLFIIQHAALSESDKGDRYRSGFAASGQPTCPAPIRTFAAFIRLDALSPRPSIRHGAMGWRVACHPFRGSSSCLARRLCGGSPGRRAGARKGSQPYVWRRWCLV
jgi:hypothetical protein